MDDNLDPHSPDCHTEEEKMTKLEKKLKKIEKEFETAGPLKKERLFRQAESIQKKIDANKPGLLGK